MSTGTLLPERLTHGRLDFRIVPRPQRRTLEITVERDATLSIKTPDGVTVEQIQRFVADKQDWIYRKLAEKHALYDTPIVKQLATGEGFAYLGRNYRLLVVDDQGVAVKLAHGRLKLRRADLSDGFAAIRAWYETTGQRWLQDRISRWSSRTGGGDVDVHVMHLGYRWGSSRGTGRINLHWAILQLPPSLIDYVLVHELIHLREPNHTPQFWLFMERAMPDYPERHDRLATAGSRLWLGAVASPVHERGGR